MLFLFFCKLVKPIYILAEVLACQRVVGTQVHVGMAFLLT